MIRRHVIGIASAMALLAASACDSGDSGGTGDDDVALDDSGRADAGREGDASSGATGDAGDRPDAEVKLDGGDGGRTSDGGDLDAARDAQVSNDARSEDARADGAEMQLDGAADAAQADAEQADAAQADAAQGDAGPLDAAQVDASSDASLPDASLPALAAWYKFDENSGTTAASSTAGFTNATLLNGASWTAGKHGSALALGGGATNQYAALPANIADSCDDITIALWMKLGSTPAWSRLLDIDGVTDGFLFFTPTEMINGVPHLLFNIFHPPGAGADDQRVSAAYPTGTTLVNVWHHVAFTLSVGTGRLYFDGVQVGSNAMTTKPADLTLGATAHAWIGRSTFPDPYLNAAIDDLRISCTAYSAAQIAALAE
jgi:hypothetical protein